MRAQPTTQPPAKIEKLADDRVTQIRKYKLITPLFGGGVKPGENDPLTPISGKAIRGHLRFWWRATRGGLTPEEISAIAEADEKKKQSAMLRKMKEKEDRIWGAASTEKKKAPSSVQVHVEIIPDKQGKRGEVIRFTSPDYGYITFPLDENNKFVMDGLRFALELSYPKNLEAEVRAAVSAWEIFGGAGARTRRGFGAVHLTSIVGGSIEALPENAEAWKKKITDEVAKVAGRVWPKGVPHIESNAQFNFTKLRSGNSEQEAIKEAWKELVSKIKGFRQLRSGYSRSHWPEPEKIRELTSQRLPRHKPLPNKLDEFPRAAFGLPIIFHFKHSDKDTPDNPNKDPRDTSLQLENHERLASPVILRPLPCLGNKAVGLAIVLNSGAALEEMKFVLKAKQGKAFSKPVKVTLDDSNKAKMIIRPDTKKPLLGEETDVLKAFLNYVTEE